MSSKRQKGKVNQADTSEQVLALLAGIDRPTTICSFGDRPVTLPGLDVKGIGPIGLPLGKAQARELIQQCQQAPYGKGTETVVDTDVRRVWELDPASFELTNPQWQAFIDSIVADVRTDLGLGDLKLKAHLYKLLVYEKGSFFLPHKDGEKLDGMVATLVVALPAIHAGGELVVSHEGRTNVIPMTGAASGCEASYAAFYADCEHEVRRVTSGYRLCLTYNLTLAKSKKTQSLKAPSFQTITAQLAETLTGWSRAQSEGRKNAKVDSAATTEASKLAVTLAHEYTKSGLVLDHLKGIDRATAEVLFEAARLAGCVAHLGLITIYQNGSAEGGDDGYGYGSGRSRRYYDSDDDDESDDDDDKGSDYTMGEVYDDSMSVDHWSDANGDKVPMGAIDLSEDEIVCDSDINDWNVSREDFEGYTGNAGMTLERWYHRATVVIWPQDSHFDVLCAAGTDASIGGFVSMTKRLKNVSKKESDTLRSDCIRFARAIIDSWNPRVANWSMSHEKTETIDRELFLSHLCDLDDLDLVQRFLSQVLNADHNLGVDQKFAGFCNRHGWSLFEDQIAALLASVTPDTVLRNVRIVERLSTSRDKNAGRLKACRRFCDQCVTALIEFDKQAKPTDWHVSRIDRKEILTQLIKSAISVAAREPLSRLVTHTMLATNLYDLTQDHIAAMFALKSKLMILDPPMKGIDDWLEKCGKELANRTAQKPQPPADFRRDKEFPCTCRDCQTLRVFLNNPNEESVRLPLAKARRQHLHNIINGHKLDVTHVTHRVGSPQVLVCTKTAKSYEDACQIYERDLKLLAELKQIQTGRKTSTIPRKASK